MTDHIAYDYDTQEWVKGKGAKRLLISQAKQELELLHSPQGPSYWLSIRKRSDSRSWTEYVNHVQGELDRLSA